MDDVLERQGLLAGLGVEQRQADDEESQKENGGAFQCSSPCMKTHVRWQATLRPCAAYSNRDFFPVWKDAILGAVPPLAAWPSRPWLPADGTLMNRGRLPVSPPAFSTVRSIRFSFIFINIVASRGICSAELQFSTCRLKGRRYTGTCRPFAALRTGFEG